MDGDGTGPTTCEYLEFHALHRPTAPALEIRGRAIPFARFHADRRRMTRALRAFDLPPGSLVAVGTSDLYLEWLILLGCEALGWASASFGPDEGAQLAPLWSMVDLVMGEREWPEIACRRFHRLAPAWAEAVLAGPEPGDEPAAVVPPDAPHRIRRSSGTTGGRKIMIVSRRQHESRLRHYTMFKGFSARTRLLIANRFAVNAVYSRATVCLRLGGACVFDIDLADLAATGCTHMWMQPLTLRQIAERLPPGFVRPANLTVQAGGAATPGPLRDLLVRRFAAEVVNNYGSNETSPISEVGGDGIGTLYPGAEVEVVDEVDRPVPPGEIGRIRVRNIGMIDGYAGTPDLTRQLFRNGWFYPGDAGVLVAPRRLRVVGRVDEIVNVGGIKMTLDRLEGLILAVTGVSDAGAACLARDDGQQQICVGFVVQPGADVARVAGEIRRRLPSTGVLPWVAAIDQIPRTETGKVQRARLGDIVAARRFPPRA